MPNATARLKLEIDPVLRPRYVAIARAIEAAIVSGQVAAGERLPTQRELSHELGIAIATIGRAFSEAERRGVIASHVGRGTFATSPRKPLDSPRSEAPSPDLLDLAMYRVRPAPLLAAVRAAVSSIADGNALLEMLNQHTPLGTAMQREAGALWLHRQGVQAPLEGILVCNGGQHGMLVTIGALTDRGEAVMTERLADPSMKAVSMLLGRQLIPVEMDGEGMLPDALDQAWRGSGARLLYCTPTFHNPTNATMSLARRQALIEVARRRRIDIVESLIYNSFMREPPPTLASLAPERTYAVVSLGRVMGPGCKLGYVSGPPGSGERLALGMSMSMGMVSPLAAEMVTRLLLNNEMQAFVDWQRTEAAARATLVRKHLADHTILAPAESTHAWLHLPEPWRADQFVENLRSVGVITSYTHSFVVGRADIPHAVRLCTGAPDSRADLATALGLVATTARSAPRFA